MQIISNNQEHEVGMMTFLSSPGTGLPEELIPKLATILGTTFGTSRYEGFIEQIYAYKGALNNTARDICGACAAFCVQYSFGDLGKTGRGLKIKVAMQRDMGEEPPEGSTWPAEADDPEPLPQYVPMVPQTITSTAS